MAKKIKKKTKIKFIPILIFLLLIVIVFFLVAWFMEVKIKNIYIYDNSIVSDQEIIELANLEDYPSFLKTSTKKVKDKIENNPYIKSVEVKRGFLAVFNIYVTEYDLLFINSNTNKIVVDKDTEVPITKEVSLPILVNYVPDTVFPKFIEKMKKVDKEVLDKISHIEYQPNDYDKERFLLYMNDGNSVYVTITRFELINKYNEIYPTLEGKKGILYLDSGNHFEIKG